MSANRLHARDALIAGCLIAAIASIPGVAQGKGAVNADKHGVAIKGYDPVAYFSQGKAVHGQPQRSHAWGGATWHFATDENRRAFVENPERYAPQYGGYCAWAVSQGHTAPIDPSAWRIVNGKLYLNYDKKIRAKWEKNRDALIGRADSNWPGIRTRLKP